MVVSSFSNLWPRAPYRVVAESESSAVSIAAGSEFYSPDRDINLHDNDVGTQKSYARGSSDVCPSLCANGSLFMSLRKDTLTNRENKEVKKDSLQDSGREKQSARKLHAPFFILCQVLATLLSSVSFAVLRWLTWTSKAHSDEKVVFEPVEHCTDQILETSCGLAFIVNENSTEELGYSKKEEVLKNWNGCCQGKGSKSNEGSECKTCVKNTRNNENVSNRKSTGYPEDDPLDLAWLFTSRQFRPVGVLAAVYPVDRQQPDQAPEVGINQQPPRDTDPSSNRFNLPDVINDLPLTMFSQELYRLGTFYNFPSDSPVFAIHLAHLGFLCLPDGAIVCYFCGVRHNDWHAGDSVFEVHRQLNPNCPIITGRAEDNQLVSVLSLEQVKQVMEMWSLSGRQVLPRELGQQATGAGGGSTTIIPAGTPSVVRAPPSDGSASAHSSQQPRETLQAANEMVVTDSPYPGTATARQSGANNTPTTNVTVSGGATHGPILDGTAQPQPPRADSSAPPPSSAEGRETRTDKQSQVVTYQNLGIVTETAKRPDMASVGARLETFIDWTSHSHTPQELSQAGFFYAGYNDCARCFFCGGGLKNWEPGDNTWVEHARWFKTCHYVRLCLGQDFIDVVQQLNVVGHQITMTQVRDAIQARRADGEKIQELVVDPAVSSLLEMRVRQTAIDAAIRRAHSEGQIATANQLVTYLQAAHLIPPLEDNVAVTISNEGLQDEEDQLVRENSEIRQQRTCKVCMDKESCILFLPCGHMVCCVQCSPVLTHCAMCRIKIKGRVRAFPGGD